jgi:hypothetical protein
MMNYFANRFSKSIKELREFSLQLGHDARKANDFRACSYDG